MEEVRKYLVVLDLSAPTPTQGAALKADLERYSTKRPMLAFAAQKRLGYFIRTSLPIRDMTFDGNLLNGDSCLFLELGNRHAVEGFSLRDLYEWLR